MSYTRLLIPIFGLLAILGALLASGRLGESGLNLAVGITLLVIGAVGIGNVILFTRLKASIDEAAARQRGELPLDDEEL
ncbi:hypothetical protein NHF40_05185 [Maricaulaceae bacterium EIL42A08]|nr:hypothetical protein [Maricaulaceae bacterium EIL42A08]MCP2678550.1 hypothetical protein [Maricaulaceae bacterium NA33B04]